MMWSPVDGRKEDNYAKISENVLSRNSVSFKYMFTVPSFLQIRNSLLNLSTHIVPHTYYCKRTQFQPFVTFQPFNHTYDMLKIDIFSTGGD